MADIETHTVNEERFAATSRVGEFELSIDATGEEGPEPNEVLVADYASCYAFALRAGADRQHDVDVGRVEVEAEADVDDDDDLSAIRFTVHLEADVDEETAEQLVATGEEICHVHSALREELEADITVETAAF